MRGTRSRFGKLCGGCALLIAGWLAGQVEPMLSAQPSKPAATPHLPDYDKAVVAYVNGVPITRQELGEELVVRKGAKQLQFLIHRRIIEQACQKTGIKVTDAEVEAEFQERMKFSRVRDEKEFERALLQKNGMSLFEYKEDDIRKELLLRKLAAPRVQVTEEDLRKAFEANYGAKVAGRIIHIVDATRRIAEEVYEKAGKSADDFIREAKLQANRELAARGGKILPIHRHSTMPAVEKAAFRLRDGEISELIEVQGGFVIFLREGLEPPDPTKSFEKEKPDLHADIQKKKQVIEALKLARELREKAVVFDYLNQDSGLKGILQRFDKMSPPGPVSAERSK